MILRLTSDEVQLIKEALESYTKALNEKARPLCTGYSPEGIALCCRRIEAETLATDLHNRQPRLFAVEPVKAYVTAAAHSGAVLPFPERAA